MVRKCKICGKRFRVPDYSRTGICSFECRKTATRLRMREYRKRPEVMQKIKEYNLKHYKRPDISQKCAVCGEVFLNARKTYTCKKLECRRLSHYAAIKTYRGRHPEKDRARGRIGKFKARNGLNPSCGTCGSPAQYHHTDYEDNEEEAGLKRYNVMPLCRQHHKEIHS